MKKCSLALMFTSAVVSTSAMSAEIYNKDGNKLDFYGRVKAYTYVTDSPVYEGDKSYVRFGFRGTTQITDTLTGYGHWEYQVGANQPEGVEGVTKTRLAYAGIKSSTLGSFDYGRNSGLLYSEIGSYTDVLPEFGAETLAKTDNFMNGRGNSMSTYRHNNLFGLVDNLSISVQHQGENLESANRPSSKANGDGNAVALAYTYAGLTTSAAYSNSNRTDIQQRDGQGDKAESWGLGMKYDQNKVYVAAIYAETRNSTPYSGSKASGIANVNKAFEVVAQYQFDSGLRPSLAYGHGKAEDIQGIGDADLVKYVDLSMYYFMNKNMAFFVDYRINLMDEDNPIGIFTDNLTAIGLNYAF